MPAAAARKKISQAAFDECVRSNINDFDLDPDEAVADAMKEFELQGVDLSDVETSYAGPDGRGEHPAAIATRAYVAAVEAGDRDAVAAAGEALRARLGGGAEETPGWCAACVGAGGVQGAASAVADVAKAIIDAADADDDAEVASSLESHLIAALATLAAVLGGDDARDTYASLKLPMAHVREVWPAAARRGGSPAALAAVAAVVAAAATRNEPCKGAFAKAGVEAPVVAVFNVTTDARALRAACDALRAVTNGDDGREPASGAFAHARAFAKAGAARALCAALENVSSAGVSSDASDASDGSDLSLLASLAQALKNTAVNDDICKDVAECGGIATTLRLLRGAATAHAGLAKSAAACLRQLAGSDANKSVVAASEGIAVLTHVARVFSERAADAKAKAKANAASPHANADADAAAKANANAAHAVVEQCLGALTALCLRHPENAARCGAEGVFEPIVECMAAGAAHKGTQRQGAMFLRNAVVRNPENVPLVLATRAEALLRAAKRNHPSDCVDVASAAMRDLGCENYNEGYKPTTAVMGADGVVRTPEELGDEPVVGGYADGYVGAIAEE
ncbi:uncharacterized protein MICPUCDRAFT_40627 [Micromonas pusilla CCMP1545]|uniref:Predicted protein n=1 Tax=Micromonas pusilla (strain CCMP1545) TaxID=564608 RepID=C1MVY4_MICPC|nr:uncharacterized protein MICPUCDRAFT_40627 [Micromonas pusilla CCMP1545]EEH56071.1 predicted protein [Micromonas pusilla CCMP1545]|eukprot:XP_003060119.1 predicted protein [Micromonas pusilla CCMP1545]